MSDDNIVVISTVETSELVVYFQNFQFFFLNADVSQSTDGDLLFFMLHPFLPLVKLIFSLIFDT